MRIACIRYGGKEFLRAKGPAFEEFMIFWEQAPHIGVRSPKGARGAPYLFTRVCLKAAPAALPHSETSLLSALLSSSSRPPLFFLLSSSSPPPLFFFPSSSSSPHPPSPPPLLFPSPFSLLPPLLFLLSSSSPSSSFPPLFLPPPPSCFICFFGQVLYLQYSDLRVFQRAGHHNFPFASLATQCPSLEVTNLLSFL